MLCCLLCCVYGIRVLTLAVSEPCVITVLLRAVASQTMKDLQEQLAQFQTEKVPESGKVLHSLCMLKQEKLQKLYQTAGSTVASLCSLIIRVCLCLYTCVTERRVFLTVPLCWAAVRVQVVNLLLSRPAAPGCPSTTAVCPQ